MRFLRRFGWMVVLALVVGAVLFYWRDGTIRREWAVVTGVEPVFDGPAEIDLGERKSGEPVAARFTITNRGGVELVIDQIRTSCSCGALEREREGGLERVERLRLSAGEQAELVMRATTMGESGQTARQTVRFRTNDPTQPEGQLSLVFRILVGEVRITPSSVVFGAVPVGQSAQQVVELRDPGATPRAVRQVVSSDARITARWQLAGDADLNSNGTLLGRIEVTADTSQPGRLDTRVSIELDDDRIPPLSLAVSGTVVPNVEVLPASLVLPLASGAGPLFTGTCQIRGPASGSFRLEVASASPGLSVEFANPADGPTRTVRITWSPAPDDKPGVSTKRVRLRATTDGTLETIEIAVTCRRD